MDKVSYNTIDDYIAQLKVYFYDDEFNKAFDLIKEVEKKIFSGEITTQNDKKGKSDYDYFSSDMIVDCLIKDMQLVERCWDIYNEVIEGREPDRESNNIQTWFKNEEDVGAITMCGKTKIKAKFMDVLSVFAEIDLIDSFIENFEKIEVIKTFSNFRLLTWDKLKMPLFVSARDMITMGIGLSLTEDKSVMLAMKSITDSHYLATEMPKETSDYVRIVLNFGFYLIKYIDENTTELTFATNIDPKVTIIPWFILNTFLKEVAYYIVLNFKERIEKIDKTEYGKRREKRKEFYGKIENRITAFTNTVYSPD